MSETEVEVRKWGNSLGIIIPADVAREEGLKEHDRALVRIMKVRYPHPSSFGSLKDLKLDAQKLKDQLRRDHE
ncbi:MAG TPA: AbrB/MazE/SpoVT family DNA-binding domain-containing protein [Candidatus Thermoplasmatota archaeon]|nr:AbrB/MazE/SpoVT family DNA-binding domain-containing protein [Candidatus Thermoplasmatota archaeon]